MAIINQVTMLTIILTGAAVIREREHGTLEHLLVMPLTAFEIAMAKVWANGLVILVATALSLFLVVQTVLKVPFAGSHALWFAGVVLYLFFATALGIFLGTISRSMAQFALLIILVVVVLQLLSGGSTPVESQPEWLQYLTFFLPSRHFVSFSQAIIYRGGGLQRGLAPVSDGRRDWSWVLRVQPGAVPEIDRRDEVAELGEHAAGPLAGRKVSRAAVEGQHVGNRADSLLIGECDLAGRQSAGVERPGDFDRPFLVKIEC